MPTINKRGIDTIMSLKKKIAAAFIACAMTLAVVPSAFACTALYVGSDLTEDGTTMFGRIEDLGTNDYNKLFNVSPAGKHTAGEVYEGCYGFTYTFTHDSYRYTARRDDNGLGVCPDCDSTHEHTPYEEAGTNEKGVMVSATESLYGTDAVLSVDPYVDNGIEEAEITTVLLSEASTAREGVALLTSIYDNAGAAGGSGVFIADQNETWFVENLTGHTYLALKLSSSVVFMQPNIAAMGKIDLDDTDHVVASANLISVAQKAGTFVGDAAANVIDLDASYNGDITSDRMAAGLNYLYGTDTFTKDNYSETDFAISNVGENGAIVPVYSNIQLTKKFSVEDSIHFFQTEPIGKTGNVETHLFQVSASGDLNTAITEWTAFDDDVYNAFVPYYPMLTTDTADVYKVSVHKVTRSDEQPTEGVWYQDAKGRYYTYPDDWTDSFYGVRDALSNLLTYGSNGNQVTAKDQAAAKASYAALQQEIMADYADMKAAVAAADTLEAKQAAAATHYPPDGIRGMGTRRAVNYGIWDKNAYVADTDKYILTIVQIEHIDVVKDLPEIAKLPGISGFVVGPNDFTMSMNTPERTYTVNDPEVQEQFDKIGQALAGTGKLFGVSGACSEKFVTDWIRRGVNYMCMNFDFNYIVSGAKNVMQTSHAVLDQLGRAY